MEPQDTIFCYDKKEDKCNKKGCLGIKTLKSNPHYFVDVIKVIPNQEVSILTVDGLTKLNTAFKAVDLNSVGTNMVDSLALKFVVSEVE